MTAAPPISPTAAAAGASWGLRCNCLGRPGPPDADALRDLLRVQYLAGIDVAAATRQLEGYTAPAYDAFVRAAAAAALRGRQPLGGAEVAAAAARRDGRGALRRGLDRLPAKFDLLLGLDAVAMPSPAPLLEAWRQWGLRLGSELLLEAGGSVSPAQLVGMQFYMDAPAQRPYELASRFGNWRVDAAVLALQCGSPDRWWLHVEGAFQVQRLANGLAQGGFAVHADGKEHITADLLGWKLSADTSSLECWQEGFDRRDAGARTPALAAHAGPGAAPLWLHLPAGSAMPARLGGVCGDFDLELQLQPARLSAVAHTADGAAAEVLRRQFAELQRGQALDPGAVIRADAERRWQDLDGLPPGCSEHPRARLACSRRLQQVRAEVNGSQVRWSFAAGDVAMLELAQVYAGLGMWLHGGGG